MTTMPPQVATVLPFEARQALQRAASVEPTPGNPMARLIAIEQAIARIRMQWPQLFKEERDG